MGIMYLLHVYEVHTIQYLSWCREAAEFTDTERPFFTARCFGSSKFQTQAPDLRTSGKRFLERGVLYSRVGQYVFSIF